MEKGGQYTPAGGGQFTPEMTFFWGGQFTPESGGQFDRNLQPVPDFNLIKVNREHIPDGLDLRYYYFETYCFGSKYLRNAKELDKFMSVKSTYLKKALGPHILTLLKIALFDIWICNDDRSFNNHNLLIDADRDNTFVPIDHVDIFHSSTLDNGLYTISKEESIFSIPLLRHLIYNKLNFSSVFQELENYLYFCTLKCKNSLDGILQEIPDNWSLDSREMTTALESYLFNDKWIKDVMDCFITYTQSVLNDHGNKL